jgi:preprotein translocase subunit SecA
VEAYESKEEQLGDEQLCRSVERFVMLRTIDQKWVDYLTTMEHFREGISLQAYGQKDPLIEYKNEAHTMFEELTEGIRADIVANMFRVQVMPQEPPPQPKPVYNGAGQGRAAAPAQASGPAEPVGVGASSKKLGRNDLCWCGSGRKYKRCHGR